MKKKMMSAEKVAERVHKMKEIRDEFLKDVSSVHVKLQKGNSKTGGDVYTVSLIPILDCQNCGCCELECYDIRNDCRFTGVMKDRAKNSAIHKADFERYWQEIENEIMRLDVRHLRINVGGDLTYEDMIALDAMANRNPQCQFLFFTKNYAAHDLFLDDYGDFSPNVRDMRSQWLGLHDDNKHNRPCAHVVYADGTTTAPAFGAYFCKGNCSACYELDEGCPSLKNGEHVCFLNH